MAFPNQWKRWACMQKPKQRQRGERRIPASFSITAVCLVLPGTPHKRAEQHQKKGKSLVHPPHTQKILKELGFLGRRTDLLSKAQPCQRIIRQVFNFKLLRKAEIKPGIIFVSQRVCQGGLKADQKSYLNILSPLTKSEATGFQQMGKLNEEQS